MEAHHAFPDEIGALACDEGGNAAIRVTAVGAGGADEVWLELVHGLFG